MFRKKTYVICASHRSGSTLLCEGMRWTWRCGDPKEYISPTRSVALFENGQVRTDCREDYQGYIDELLRTKRSDNGVFGIKVMWKHLQKLPRNTDIPCAMQDHRRLARTLQTVFGKSYFLWSRRENKAQQAISFLKAKQTGFFTHQQEAQGERVAERENLAYDFDAIHSLAQRFEEEEEHWQTLFRLAKIKPLVITYEEIASNYQSEVERALRHIRVWDKSIEIAPPKRNQKLADTTSSDWYERYQNDLKKKA